MVANATRSRAFHIQKPLKSYFLFFKRPQPMLPSVKIWWQFVQQEPKYGPKYDFIQLWPWKVKVIREVNNILHCNPHTTHEHICEVSLRSYWQFLWKSLAQCGQKWLGERKKEPKEKQFDGRWRFVMPIMAWMSDLTSKWPHNNIIWRSFPEILFGISRVSIHWAAREIEPPKLCLKSSELL